LPRPALLLFCLAYLLPGFFGRAPWKSADMTAFGYMRELALGHTPWLTPKLMGLPPESDGLLPYWLGAWAMQAAPAWIAPELAARSPFIALLTLTLMATWYGIYSLARSPDAQPVAFAFGGEALPADYARAIADGGLLAFIACLGLAQLSHETTPAVAQLCFTALTFYAVAALPYRTVTASISGWVGLTGLALSGAPTLALLFGMGSTAIHLMDRSPDGTASHRKWWASVGIAVITALVSGLTTQLDLWRWHIDLPTASWIDWRGLGRLLLWFTWPAWPLAIWTVWRWRRQLIRGGAPSRHLALPLWLLGVTIATTLVTDSADRSLLLALPALAALAAFALPTLKRSVAALIDWFTLIFFSGCALIIWVIWIAMQTGVPAQPAANVARLVPGFQYSFTFAPFLIALAATLAWAWLVKWRAGRHRAAIWKSMVLPAGGAALCWLLLMTLWLPLLDFTQSYAAMVRRTRLVIGQPTCIEVLGLSRGHIAAFQFHGQWTVRPMDSKNTCPWLVVDKEAVNLMNAPLNLARWRLYESLNHPLDPNEELVFYKRRR
jgi:hypothetical protein